MVAVVTDAQGNLVPGAAVSFTVADGASITTVTGTTGADGKATAEVTSTAAGTYLVTATVNGKATQKNTTFVADSATAEITDANLTINPDGAVADGVAKNGVEATVTDANGNLVPGVEVDFSISEGANIHVVQGTTDENGKAYAEITSMKAGTFVVSAHVVGSAQFARKNTRFVADMSTAKIELVRLGDKEQFVVGSNANYTATAMDANGNLITDAEFELDVKGSDNASGAILVVNDGVAALFVTDTKVGDVELNVVLQQNNDVKASGSVAFIADKETATIAENDLTVLKTGAVASGTDENSVQARVTDAYGNILSDMDVTFGVNKTATLTQNVIKTDSEGLAVAHLTDTEVEAVTVTATINGNSQAVEVEFVVGDVNPSASTVTLEPVRILANGTEQATITVKLEDFFGHPVSGKNVTVEIFENQPITASASVHVSETVDHADGSYSLTASGTKAGTVQFNIFVDGNSIELVTDWLTLVSTGEIAESDMVINPDNAVADGVAKNVVTTVVKDFSGTPVAGDEVTFNVEDGAVLTPITTTTGDDGKAVAEITSTKAGAFKVTATVNGKSTSKDTTFVADATTARMVLTAVNPLDSHPAGSKANFTASVQDANGNVFKDAEIELSASGTETTEAEITGVSDGVANLFVTDTKVGEVSLTVNQKGNSELSAAETVKFIADISTARVLESDFDTPKANAIANGEDEVEITASVTDQYGNPIPVGGGSTSIPGNGVRLSIDVTGTTTPGFSSRTNYSENTITFNFTQSNTGTYGVRPLINGNPVPYLDSKIVKFIPVLREFRLNNNNQPADGISPITLVVRLTSGMSDYASGYSGVVSFTATNGAVMSSEQITTSGGGVGTGYGPVIVRNVNPGTSTVTATFEQAGIIQQLTVDAEFVNAATILDNDLIINPDNAVANGADKNVVTAIVTDGNGTAVAGEEVTFSVENGPELTVVSATSDADGKAVAELTSTVAGSFKVTATVNGNTVSKNTTFIADATTAAIELTRTNVQETYVAGTRIGYTAVAKDANGNTINDAEFEVKAEGGTAASASITSTNNGVAVLSLYDTRAGETKLTITLANNAEVAADDTVTYVPDESSSKISNMTVVKDWALAAFLEENIVTFEATDKFGNLIPSVDSNAFRVAVAPPTGGKADWNLNQLESGIFELRVKGDISNNSYIVNVSYGSVAGSSERQAIWFAGILAPLSIEKNDAPANGQSKNVIKGRIYHGLEGPEGSLGPRLVKLNFKVDNGAILTAVPGYEVYGSGNGTNNLTIWSDSAGYASVEVTNTTPGNTTVIMTELSQGTSQSERTTVNFEPVIELRDQNVVIDPDNAPADGVSKNVATATVTNQNGSPVAGAEVSFEVEAGPVISVVNGTTGADGKAVAELTSLQKGVFNVTVKVNDSEVTKPVTFISDAVIKDENMVVDPDGAISNALNRNRVTAIVTDSAGNPLSGETVVFTVEEETGLYLYPIITTTGDDGKAVAELSSGKFGTFNVTATVNGKSTTKPTTFVQWGIAVVEANIIKNNALADEEDTNEIEAKVEDGNFNPVAGAKVTFWVEGNSNARPITFVENEVLTDENGYARTKIKANRPGSYQIVATAYDYSSAGKSAWFTFVTSGLNTDKSALKVTPPVIKADNNEFATIELKVRDKFDTAITGQDVSFVIENEDGSSPAVGEITLSAVTEGDPVILDESGYYTATLKGATPGRYKITPVVEGNRVGLSEVIELTSTAQILESGLTLELDGSVADGEAKNIVTATVTDFAGKPVSGETVVFMGDDGMVITTVTEVTGADGKALAELTSTSAGTFIVRASVNGSTAQIETNFVAGLAVGDGHSTMDVNIARIIANGGGKVDGKDVARLTFVAKDAFDNAVTGLVNIGALSFIAKDESQNVISDSQQLDINNVTETQEGIYIADVQGTYVGKVTIHPVIKQGAEESYTPDVNSAITLFDYSFKVGSDKLKIIVGGTSGFYIHATSSDNVDSNVLLADSNSLTYVSSNTAVITVNSNGDATGVGVGEALIFAVGEYNGLELSESNTSGALASVKQSVTYGPFGDSANPQARRELFIVREEDNYTLFARSGSIVDALGVSESHKIGGRGGLPRTLINLNQVARITTCTTPDIFEENNPTLQAGVSQIVLEYRDGTPTEVLGENKVNTSDCSHVVEVPEGYSLDGFDVRGNVYIHSVGYILNPDGFE
ncbi:Ig-like domain-containing protein [Enterobacter cloacae]|uniref:Ig-like domain-containing protein n=1 Tax=Enterobacter cloacae TaxID=550 RepID=UPI001D06B8FC|nr:Ig-like domain-containing protein [Enterobacter cloacae]